MHPHLTEFALIALFHLLAVASPGPDFAIVLKQSVAHGRRAALWSSLGIGAGILLHANASLFGISLIFVGSAWAFLLLKFAGAAYLFYLGVMTLRASHATSPTPSEQGVVCAALPIADRKAFLTGLLVNGLNPKALLFFIALFTVVINPATPLAWRVGYGLYMAIATALWFSLLSLLFTGRRARAWFVRFGHWVERLMGVALIGLSVELALSTLRP